MTNSGHIDGAELQAYLEGALGEAEKRAAEVHLDRCAQCAAELEGWRALFQELEALPEIGPTAGFGERILTELSVMPPGRRSLWERLREAIIGGRPGAAGVGSGTRAGTWPGARPGTPIAGHPTPGRIQELLDGRLAGRARQRMEAHLDACGMCARERAEWGALFGTLDDLPPLQPTPGFAQRVMEEIDARAALAPAREGAPTPVRDIAETPVHGAVPSPLGGRLEALQAGARGRASRRGWGLVPSTRRGWGFAGAVVAGPALAMLGILGAILAHPLLTLDGLASFLIWQGADRFNRAFAWTIERFAESAVLGQASTIVQAALSSPGPAIALLAAAWVTTLAAAWIVYRNVFSPSFTMNGHARASS